MGPPCSSRRLRHWGRHCEWKRPTPTKLRSPCSAPCLERWPSASSATLFSRPTRPRSRATRWPAARPPRRPPPRRRGRARSSSAGVARQGRRRQGPERRQDLPGLPQLRQGRRRQGRPAAVGRRRPAGRLRRRLRLFRRAQGDRRRLDLREARSLDHQAGGDGGGHQDGLPRRIRGDASAPTFSPTCRSSRTARFRSRNRRVGRRATAKGRVFPALFVCGGETRRNRPSGGSPRIAHDGGFRSTGAGARAQTKKPAAGSPRPALVRAASARAFEARSATLCSSGRGRRRRR